MATALEHSHLDSFEESEDELSGVTGDFWFREIGDISISDPSGMFDGLCEVT
jgi:hypothetical protein